MQFRESTRQSFHRTIFRISFSSRIPGIKISGKSWVGIVEFRGSRLNPSPCLTTILVEDGDSLSRAEGFFKKKKSWSTRQIPCIVRQSRIATKHASGTRKSRGFTGNMRHNRAGRCLRIVKIFHSRHSFCLAEPGSWTRADSS